MIDSHKCPFRGSLKIAELLKRVDACNNVPRDDELTSHYGFSGRFMSDLFPPEQFPTIDDLPDLESINTDDSAYYDSKNVIIVAMQDIPEQSQIDSIHEGIKFCRPGCILPIAQYCVVQG